MDKRNFKFDQWSSRCLLAPRLHRFLVNWAYSVQGVLVDYQRKWMEPCLQTIPLKRTSHAGNTAGSRPGYTGR